MANLNLTLLVLIVGIFDCKSVSQGFENYLNIKNRYRRQNIGNNCLIPTNPPNGQLVIGGDDSHYYKAGDYVENLKPLFLHCDSQFKPIPLGVNYSYCLNGTWFPTPSTCARTCKTLMSTSVTKIECIYTGIVLLTCDNPVEGTVLSFSCAPYYEDVEQYPYRICLNGEWNGIPKCSPICGEKRSTGYTNIVNGTSVIKGDFPWHVGIYEVSKGYICGGSIISERVIVTAAHCLSNLNDGTPYPKENYFIAAGKYFRQFDDTRDPHPQFPTIAALHIPHNYRGGALQHDTDIAVIVLSNDLILSETVQPVCVDWSSSFEHEQLIPNLNGTVVGWGFTKEGQDLSDELKELIIPFVPFKQCYDSVPQSFKKYVRQDKICGGYLESGKSICGGDSGGGLVFPRQSNGRYYLRGIVSTSPSTGTAGDRCDSQQYGLFTSLSKHILFVNDLYLLNQPSATPIMLLVPTTTTTSRTTPNSMTNKLNPVLNHFTFPPTVPTHSTIITTPTSMINKWTTMLNDVTYVTYPSTTVTREFPLRVVEIHKFEQKCQEYRQLLGFKNSPAAIQNCVSSVREHVGGLRAAPKEFPHMARVGYLDSNNGISWLCDGSLISEKFVLTSAKCLTSRPHGLPTKVLLGDHASGDNSTFQEFYVVNHYVYHNFTAMTLYNDIALLELDRNANFNTYVRPACLNINFTVPKLLTVTGWENDSHFQNHSLLKIPIHKVSHSECTTAYATLGARVLRHGIMDETQICARFKTGRLNTFNSGAPLQILNEDRCTFRILGVTSVSSGSEKPHIHTRVSAYVNWIEDIVWPD